MIAGLAFVSGEGRIQPEAFPGRWSSRRAIPRDVEPAATAAALALEDAGWWRAGSGEPVEGSLIVACDGSSLDPSLRFARELRDRPAGAVGPADFLFSLPSSVAATLGLFFGLTEYQSTLVGSRDSALRALRHALDLLELGRVRRALLVTLAVTPHERSAVAWCLNPQGSAVSPDREKYPARIDCGFAPERRRNTIGAPREGAHRILRDATAWLRSEEARPESAHEVSDGYGWIRLERTANW